MRGGTGRVDRRRVALLVFGLVVAAIASGCQYLFGYGPNPPDFGMPQPVAVYREGRATVKLGDEPIMALDELEDTGSFDPAFVSLDRIVGTQHWTVADPTSCVVTIFAADATGLMGAATCKGLRWSDALGSYDVTFQPPYIKDQPAFDAEITFEATASTKQVG